MQAPLTEDDKLRAKAAATIIHMLIDANTAYAVAYPVLVPSDNDSMTFAKAVKRAFISVLDSFPTNIRSQVETYINDLLESDYDEPQQANQ